MHRYLFLTLLAGFPLLADPLLDYIAVLSGANGLSIARDGSGNIYVGGITASSTFPATGGAFQTTYHGGICERGLSPGGPCYDVFVAKWDRSGTQLLWATYLGGSGDDYLGGMAVDAAGNVYLTGWTSSSDFPVTPGAFQTEYHGTNSLGGYTIIGDAFVTKLNPSGTALVYSTYLGGSGSDSGAGIAIDAGGNAYVTGTTGSTDFPVTRGVLQPVNHGNNAFVVKLNAAGNALLFSTLLGGSGSDGGGPIAVDTNGVVYVGGWTSSMDFPVTPGAFQTSLHGGAGAFLARINSSGSMLLSATYFGGSLGAQLTGLTLDPSGQIYIAGTTNSPDLPVTPDALQNQIGSGVCGSGLGGEPLPCSDAFIARFDSNGAKLTYSTYLGGTSYEENATIAVDSQGAVYVAGQTDSADFPVTADAFQPCSRAPGYPGNAFIAKFVPGGPLLYSTLLGGSGGASAAGVAVDDTGGIYVTGNLAPAFLLVPGYTDLYFPENDFPPQPVPLIVVGAGEPNGVFVGKIDTSSVAPASRIGCIVNAASHLGGGVSPGEIVEISGTHIGPDRPLGAQFTSYGSVSTSLGGVEVDFDGLAAPLLSVQSDRIEAIVPYGYPLEGDFVANVQVFYDGNATGVFPAVIQPALPAVFSMDGSGQGQAAVLNEDGTLNSPSNPALKGSVVSIFCTGLGAVVNPPGDGTINSGGLPTPAGPVSVSIGGWSADVLFAGGAPGQVFGAFQVNARVPMQPATGPAVPVLVFLDASGIQPAALGNAGPGVVTIAIK